MRAPSSHCDGADAWLGAGAERSCSWRALLWGLPRGGFSVPSPQRAAVCLHGAAGALLLFRALAFIYLPWVLPRLQPLPMSGRRKNQAGGKEENGAELHARSVLIPPAFCTLPFFFFPPSFFPPLLFFPSLPPFLPSLPPSLPSVVGSVFWYFLPPPPPPSSCPAAATAPSSLLRGPTRVPPTLPHACPGGDASGTAGCGVLKVAPHGARGAPAR